MVGFDDGEEDGIEEEGEASVAEKANRKRRGWGWMLQSARLRLTNDEQ